jgi:hypothetical protein
MKSTAVRVLVSFVGVTATWILYAVSLNALRLEFGYDSIHFGNYQLILLFAVPGLICLFWSIVPNLFRKFDSSSLVASILALIFSLAACLYGSVAYLSCGIFGDCF